MLKLFFAAILILVGFGGTLLVDPFWGLAVFSLFTHITPQQLSMEIIVPLRIPFFLSIWVLLGYLLSRNYPSKFSKYPLEFWFMLLMLMGMFLGTMNAVDQDMVYEKTEVFIKYIVFFFLLVNIIDSEFKVKWFINAQILSAAWLVYRCWDLRHRFSSRFENTDGGVISDSNHFAAAVVLLFPLVVRQMFSGHWLKRVGAAVGAFGMVMTVVITGSRGGFLGLAVQSMAFLYFYKEYRKRIFLALAGLSIIILPFVSDYYIERIVGIFAHEEIEDTEARDSVNSRLASWSLSIETWQQMPFIGCGMQNFRYYMGYYKEGLNWGELGHVAHSTWLQVLAEGGLAVFLPFMFILILFYRRTFMATRFYAGLKRMEDVQDIYAIQIGMTGFLVCATFLNRLFYEPIYWFAGLAAAYTYIIRAHQFQSAKRGLS